MSMDRYESIRLDGWKNLYKNDRHFSHGDAPTAKVISFFCKRRANEPIVSVVSPTKKIVDFDIQVEVSWFATNLTKTLRYKKKWYGEKDITNFATLQQYLDQCEGGGFSKCVLSKHEYMMIKPNKK